jgi:hypothetical protein
MKDDLTENEKRVTSIDARLYVIDRVSIRALRANENDRLAELELEAVALRAERATLI